MSPCSSVDLKAYALGEATPDEVRAVKAHAAMCPACSSELERLRSTKSALMCMREEELPRRIAFVSDREVVPFWWQVRRMFPHLILPAAVLGALAFFLLPGLQPQRPPTLVVQIAPAAAPAGAAANVDVEKRIQAAVAKAVADSEARQQRKTLELVAAADKKHNVELRSVQVAFEEAWRLKEKQLSTMYVALNRMDDGSSR